MASGPITFDDPSTWTGAIDRCPCGTGTSAKMAVLHAKGELTLHQPFRHEGLLGTVYTGELVKEIEIAGRASVVPTIGGQGMDLRVQQPRPRPDGPLHQRLHRRRPVGLSVT